MSQAFRLLSTARNLAQIPMHNSATALASMLYADSALHPVHPSQRQTRLCNLASSSSTCSASGCCFYSTPTSSFASQPHRLDFNRAAPGLSPALRDSVLFQGLLKLTGYYSRKNQQTLGAQLLFTAVKEIADNEKFYSEFGLDRSKFMSTYFVMSLHVWLILARLRADGTDTKYFQQRFYEAFFRDVERRVYQAGVQMHLSKWLGQLEKVFYGTSLAYDRSLAGGSNADENFTYALLRNVYENDTGRLPDAERLAAYLKRELECLALTNATTIMEGLMKFSYE